MKGKSKAKSFQPGEVVEVRRTVGGKWVTANYVGLVELLSRTRFHRVQGENVKHYIDSMTGMEVTFRPEDHPRAYLIDTEIVPASRIRARKV